MKKIKAAKLAEAQGLNAKIVEQKDKNLSVANTQGGSESVSPKPSQAVSLSQNVSEVVVNKPAKSSKTKTRRREDPEPEMPSKYSSLVK